MASSIPPVKPGSAPKLSALEAKALRGLRATAFRFTGQTAHVYRGSFSPTDLTKLGLPGQLGRQTADKLRQLGATREQVTSYINSSAVALRTVAAIYKGSKLLTVSINSSARLSHPVSVSAPPASKTIAYSKVAGG